jgi:hypothetical protein
MLFLGPQLGDAPLGPRSNRSPSFPLLSFSLCLVFVFVCLFFFVFLFFFFFFFFFIVDMYLQCGFLLFFFLKKIKNSEFHFDSFCRYLLSVFVLGFFIYYYYFLYILNWNFSQHVLCSLILLHFHFVGCIFYINCVFFFFLFSFYQVGMRFFSLKIVFSVLF